MGKISILTTQPHKDDHVSLLGDPRNRRWLGWGALALVFLLVNLHRLSTAVLAEELTIEFEITAAQLGALHASFFVVYALIQIPTGILADRHGPRYVGAAGAIVLSLGALGFTASEGYVLAVASRTLIGLGSGVIFISILRFAANWFRVDEFATLVGLTGGIAGIGAILATTPLAMAITALGWRSTIAGLGVIGLLAAVCIIAVVRRSPRDAGLDPIPNVPTQPAVGWQETKGHLATLLRDPDQWLLSVIYFSALGSILTIIGLWGVPYLVVVYDLSVTAASYYTLIGSVGVLLGAPTVGWISDRVGRRHGPMVVGFALYTLAVGLVPVIGRPPLFLVAISYFLIGFSLGFVMLGLPIIKEKYPAGASGVATATINGWGFIGAAVLPYLMGIALDEHRTGDVVAGAVVYTETGYRIAFGIVTVAMIGAFVCTVAVWLRGR